MPAGEGSPGMAGTWCQSWGRQDALQGCRAWASAQVQADHHAAAGSA